MSVSHTFDAMFYMQQVKTTWMRLKVTCTYDTDISCLTEVLFFRSSVIIDVHKASLFADDMLLCVECKMFLILRQNLFFFFLS